MLGAWWGAELATIQNHYVFVYVAHFNKWRRAHNKRTEVETRLVKSVFVFKLSWLLLPLENHGENRKSRKICLISAVFNSLIFKSFSQPALLHRKSSQKKK
uniref:(northern house mosquito) hypothetical protein n=1 Tax=Culex pipiens TaxID=7175 RepID=A0A8D8KN35_CULPI